MKIEIQENSGIITATLKGRLDTVASEQIVPDFNNLLEQADKNIILDCEQMEYICSSGLRLFLTLGKKTDVSGGHLTVRHPNEETKKVFKLTGFYKLLDIEE